jgi:hypothetical protein
MHRAGTKYDHLVAILGKTAMATLANQRVFLVGAGALGCEFLKNFGASVNASVAAQSPQSCRRCGPHACCTATACLPYCSERHGCVVVV